MHPYNSRSSHFQNTYHVPGTGLASLQALANSNQVKEVLLWTELCSPPNPHAEALTHTQYDRVWRSGLWEVVTRGYESGGGVMMRSPF